jgi:tetratricopeptide (TPR) repeat protein
VHSCLLLLLRICCVQSTLSPYKNVVICLCRLLYRSHTEYDEAIKCYKNALRMDPESIQVMRDLATLQASCLLKA